MSRACVICKAPVEVGRLATIYAAGVRQGWREAEAGESIPQNDERSKMCATHRRQVEDALVELNIRDTKSAKETE